MVVDRYYVGSNCPGACHVPCECECQVNIAVRYIPQAGCDIDRGRVCWSPDPCVELPGNPDCLEAGTLFYNAGETVTLTPEAVRLACSSTDYLFAWWEICAPADTCIVIPGDDFLNGNGCKCYYGRALTLTLCSPNPTGSCFVTATAVFVAEPAQLLSWNCGCCSCYIDNNDAPGTFCFPSPPATPSPCQA